MGNPKGFLEVERKEAGYRPIHDRIHDFGEVEQTLNSRDRQLQASRCMDCGVPFCHWACPLHNKMPEWNDALYKGDWRLAYELLSETNDFPEFTGRVCRDSARKRVCSTSWSTSRQPTARMRRPSSSMLTMRTLYIHISPHAMARKWLSWALVPRTQRRYTAQPERL